MWLSKKTVGTIFHSLRLEGKKKQIFYFTLTTKDIKEHWYIKYDIYLVCLQGVDL